MPNLPRRESIDTLGLIVVKHAIEPNPKAECVGHGAMHIVDRPQAEIGSGETVQSVVDSLRKAAARYAGQSEAAQEVADLLLMFADRVEQIDETVGELLSRTGLDEGESIEIRFPTVAEDQAKLAAAADVACHRTNERPTAVRDAHGAPLEAVRWEHWPEAEAR